MDGFLTSKEAASQLGISVAGLYQWLAESDAGSFVIRGQPFTIDYFQGGAKGQGRIRIEPREVERLMEAMRVRPRPSRQRKSPVARQQYPGIIVPLGRPNGGRDYPTPIAAHNGS